MAEWEASTTYHPMQLHLLPELPTEVQAWYNFVVASNMGRIQRAVLTTTIESRPRAYLVEQKVDVFINYLGQEDLILP